VLEKAVKVLEVFFNCKSKKKRKEETKKLEKKKKKEKKKQESEKGNQKEETQEQPDIAVPTSTETQSDKNEELEMLLEHIKELKQKLDESERVRMEQEQEIKNLQNQANEREQKILQRLDQEMIDLKKEFAMKLEMEKLTNARLQRQVFDKDASTWGSFGENTFMAPTNNHKGLKHVVVCDTNALLSDTPQLWRLLSNDTPLLIGVPFSVVKDLENLVSLQTEESGVARRVLNALDKRSSGTIIVQRIEDVPSTSTSAVKLGNDDLIIRYAAELAKSERSGVALITSDTGLRVKGRGYPNELVLYESPDAYLMSLKPNR
jgi:hypothetical protein